MIAASIAFLLPMVRRQGRTAYALFRLRILKFLWRENETKVLDFCSNPVFAAL